MNFAERFSGIVTIDNGIRQYSGISNNGTALYLAGDLLNQLASQPIDIRICNRHHSLPIHNNFRQYKGKGVTRT